MSNDDIVEQARTYIGTKFKDKGRSRKQGIDCIGLCICVLHDLNITKDDYTAYGRYPKPNQARKVLYNYFDKVSINDIEPGDILYIRMHELPQHFAIYTGYSIIHAFQMVGKCVESRYIDEWKNKTVEAYRVRR